MSDQRIDTLDLIPVIIDLADEIHVKHNTHISASLKRLVYNLGQELARLYVLHLPMVRFDHTLEEIYQFTDIINERPPFCEPTCRLVECLIVLSLDY